MYIRYLDAHRGFSGNTLDQDGLGFQCQAEIFREARDPTVLDAGFGLELVRCDHRAGINLRDAPADIELLALLFDGARSLLQIILIDSLAALCRSKQVGRRQTEIGRSLGNARCGRWFGRSSFLFRIAKNDGARVFGLLRTRFVLILFINCACVVFRRRLLRNWWTSRHLDLLETLAHSFLFAFLAPCRITLPERRNEVQFAQWPAQRFMGLDK